MGLDWNPGNKAKSGFELEFRRLFDELRHSPPGDHRQVLENRFFEISTSAYETLGAPQVGRDPRANAWIEERYRDQKPTMTLAAWLSEFDGFYVVPLVAPCHGIPRYTNGTPGGYVEPFSFRGQFLVDCEELIGKDMLEMAYESKLPKDFQEYGAMLLAKAEEYGRKHGIELPPPDSDDPDSRKFRLDVVFRAGLWCCFWAERGHVLDAYW